MTKPLWKLQITRNQQRGAETSYTVRRQPAAGEGGTTMSDSPQASPQSWGRLSRVLEQVASIDRARLDAVKKELDAHGVAEIAQAPLNSLDLRLIGFTDLQA